MDSIYGSESDHNSLNIDNNSSSFDKDSNTLKNNATCNNSVSIENDNDEPCPSLYVNTLSNLLSVHHISGTAKILPDKLDSTLILSTASSSGSTIVSSTSKDILVGQATENPNDNASILEISNTSQAEEQFMDLQEEP